MGAESYAAALAEADAAEGNAEKSVDGAGPAGGHYAAAGSAPSKY